MVQQKRTCFCSLVVYISFYTLISPTLIFQTVWVATCASEPVLAVYSSPNWLPCFSVTTSRPKILRIDNSFPLETRAQERDSNPEPGLTWAASPMDQGPARPRFPETKPPQAEAPTKSRSQNTSAGLIMMVPKDELLKLPNGGRESSSVNFMNLKSSRVTNQIQLPKKNTGFRPNPVTIAQNQENQVTNLDILTNERNPAEVPFRCSYTRASWPPTRIFPNILMKPLWKILSLGAGCYICL
ncbi:hypothetical protein DSO57_1004172 [Entomophthora muscae]|uniref:Uncharacterized protein n=1 Tax=Entomophthora muscae TaxID=34485 RepID=A0ACC2UTK9_9FUNG|nr:hypothetical protein DSO57_1004172 [Entomophthora muscae]